MHTFRPQTLTRLRWLRPLLRLLPPPRDPLRVVHILEALLDFDNRAILPDIRCPALVIGGEDDQLIDAALQREMAALLPQSQLKLYPGYGHANDQENPEYNREGQRLIAAVG